MTAIVVDEDLRWRTAKYLIELYGERALGTACRRAEQMDATRRDDGHKLWRDIAFKVRLLQAEPNTLH